MLQIRGTLVRLDMKALAIREQRAFWPVIGFKHLVEWFTISGWTYCLARRLPN